MKRLLTLTDKSQNLKPILSPQPLPEKPPSKNTLLDKLSTMKPYQPLLKLYQSYPNLREIPTWFRLRRLRNQSTRLRRPSKERRTSRAHSSRPSSKWPLKDSLIHQPSKESSNYWDKSRVISKPLPKTNSRLRNKLTLISKLISKTPDQTSLPTLLKSNQLKRNSPELRNKSQMPDNILNQENMTEPPIKLILMKRMLPMRELPLSMKIWLPNYNLSLLLVLKP